MKRSTVTHTTLTAAGEKRGRGRGEWEGQRGEVGGAEGRGGRGRGEGWEGQRGKVGGEGWDGQRARGGRGKRGRVGGALGRGRRGRGGGRCNTHYTNYMTPVNDQLPTVHSVYISLLPLPHTSTHKGTTHSPSNVALAEVLM